MDIWKCPECKTDNASYHYECVACEHKRPDLVGEKAAKYIDKEIPRLHKGFNSLIDNLNYLFEDLESNYNYSKERDKEGSPRVAKLKETIDLLNITIKDFTDFYFEKIDDAFAYWGVSKDWMHIPTEDHVLSEYILPLDSCREGLAVFILRFEELIPRRCGIRKLVDKLKTLSLHIEIIYDQLKSFECENTHFSVVQNPEYANLERIEFVVADPTSNIRHELCVYNEEETIECTLTIVELDDVRRCEYIIEDVAWQKFKKELFIDNAILNMSKEEFNDFEMDQYIHDDLSYKLKIVFDGNYFEYNGGTSSNGVKKIRCMFEKYCSPPKDIAYDYYTKTTECF